LIGLSEVQAAAERIRPFVVRTPLERSIGLSNLYGVDVWLKLECFQLTGSFKLRGALNALMQLESHAPVVTASAGNHGLGIARAASLLGLPAIVVVPQTASQTKVDALARSGAQLIQHGETYDDAEAEALRLSRSEGIRYVSAYNDPAVVAGGGTIAREILQDVSETQTLLIPAGGGGLIGGIGLTAHALRRDATVIGVQSEASPALHAALSHGGAVSVDVRPSLADGLAGNVERESITLGLLREHVREVVLVSEAEIADSMRWLLFNERVLVEGSAAVGVAALLSKRVQSDGPIVAVLSGRNVAASVLRETVLRQ
jgi:threonine dehydratase